MPFHITSSDIDNYLHCLSPSSSSSNTKQNILSSGRHLQLLLSALTEPSMLLLLSKENCPIDPIGSVNVRNKFTLIDLPRCQQTLQNTLDNESKPGPGLIAMAKLDQNVRKVKRGWKFTIIVELLLDQTGTDTGNGSAIYKQEFTMLEFHKHPQQPSIPPPNATTSINIGSIGMFDIGEEEPWNWARISKDYNPIHTSSTAAKLLGFKSTIAHGNHIVSKAIQQLSDHKIQMDKGMKGWIKVEFKRPIIVPSTLEIKMYPQETEKEEQLVEIWMNGKVATTITFGNEWQSS
ncbi:hypothetical protein L486_07450 [Kwoniella mangroviensis CBS 10435]|uniref:MaoC-like domain-containing protein n=2 Tax=Kwoniella mangrovensis TaxID=463800 RepID=A0A1B9IIG7_9TREE|nr:uncharacterized protein I203_05010 [Kwoniella mangroviensis CBS 8507]OCF55335.1 hypothetical protein L486_07450 [Kwoniella mangroviensis CBS 10435]OCF65988.1 hypothetical protein I203_05010 [Kwoniella mangroviensis CBS 8507]OCF71938.1 hypothetical protein I204_07201 [Kwoniella mangroviensis CBS 8886]